jgi:hypothetical protein
MLLDRRTVTPQSYRAAMSTPSPSPGPRDELPGGLELKRLSSRELLALYSRIITELIGRGVVRSRNAPAGDYAELLVAEHYRGELVPPSEKSFDVLVPGGRHLQVKARVVVDGDRRSHSYSAFRTFAFDACVFLVFDSVDYRVREAREIPVEVVKAMASDVTWVRGKRVNVRQVLACTEHVIDLGEELRATAQRIDDEGTDGRAGQGGSPRSSRS